MASALMAGTLLVASAVFAVVAVSPQGRNGEPKGAIEIRNETPFGLHWPDPIGLNGTGAARPFDPNALSGIVQQMLPRGGAEPSIGITSKGNLFVATGEYVQRSTDKGKTWEDVYNFVSHNFPSTVDRFGSYDPMLWVDPLTDRIFVSHLTAIVWPVFTPYCTDLSYSDDEGETWTTSVLRDTFCDTPGLIDHQKLVTAPYGPKTLLNAADLPVAGGYPNVLYLCTNKQLETWCGVSYDGGDSIAHSRYVREPTLADIATVAGLGSLVEGYCPGINGHPAAYPDGTVVVPICNAFKAGFPPTVSVTEDNGLTWTVREFPGDVGQVEIDPDITITPDGTAYMLFRGTDQMVHLLRSRDKFATWEGPFEVAPADLTIAAFTVITSGDNDRVALAYLGTRDNQTRPQDLALPPEDRPIPEPSYALAGTRWHLFVATSDNAGADDPTFIVQQVTPEEDPVQVGCIHMYGGGSDFRGCRNLLDFIDLEHDADGRFFVAFTDGCTPRAGCTGDIESAKFQSRDQEVAVAVQDHGPSLFLAKGVLAALGLVPPAPAPR